MKKRYGNPVHAYYRKARLLARTARTLLLPRRPARLAPGWHPRRLPL